MLERTWKDVVDEMERSYHGPTLARWRTQIKSAPFQLLHTQKLLETDATHFLAVLRHPRTGSSTRKWLGILKTKKAVAILLYC